MSITPTDHLRKGELPCGIQYFVLGNTSKPKNAVELRLIVKVGSLMEEDEEQGLAHFIEHLGFKGTENYPKYELVRFLQSLGVAYGADLNASTHLLETTYQLSIDLESGFDALIRGISVLKEWAFHMRFDEHDITEEKSVIYAEYVSKQGLSARLLEKYWEAVFSDPSDPTSRLARRMPIGIPEVFMNTNASEIRNFYEKWYTPDNMALVVVGDFLNRDGYVESVIEALTDSFKSCPPKCTTSPIKQSLNYLKLPDHHKRDTFIALTDKELTVTQVTFEFFFPCPSANTVEYLRQDIIRRIICSVYDRRLHSIASGECPLYAEASPPFISAGISIRQVVRGLLCFGISATIGSDTNCSDGKVTINGVRRSISSLLLEMKRFADYGVTSDEFITAKNKWEMLFCDQRDHTKPDTKSRTSDLVQYVLSEENGIFQDPAVEATTSLDCLKSISLEEVNLEISKLDMHTSDDTSQFYYGGSKVADGNNSFRVICGQFPCKSESGQAVITDNILRSVLEEERELIAAQKAVAHWVNAVYVDPSTVIAAARNAITSRKHISTETVDSTSKLTEGIKVSHFDDTNVTELILENGITVALKRMPEGSPNKISMQAFSLGGSTEISEPEEIIMSRLDSIAGQSYFDSSKDAAYDFSLSSCESSLLVSSKSILRGSDVLELQSRMKTYVNTQRHHNHRGIGGSCPSGSFELLLALVVLKLTAQKIHLSAVEKNIHLVRSELENMNNLPEAKFMERARVLSCGDIPICRPISASAVDSILPTMASDLYARGFLRDPTEFTFVFVGDFPSLDITIDLLTSYLSHLRPVSSIPPWINPRDAVTTAPFTPLPATFPVENVHDELSIRQAEKSSVLIIFRKDVAVLEAATENLNVFLDALCKVMEVKLLDYLRIQLGKVYNVVVDHSRNSLSHFTLLTIGFHCEPQDCGLIEEAVQAVIDLMQRVGPETSCLEGIIETLAKKHVRDLESPSHWLFWILDAYKDKEYENSCSRSDPTYTIPSLIEARTASKLKCIQENLTVEKVRHLVSTVFGSTRVTVVLSPEIEEEYQSRLSTESESRVMGYLPARKVAAGANLFQI